MREVAARDAHGGEGRIRASRFPARKSLEEFDFDHARGLKRDTVAHLGTTCKTHLATGTVIQPCQIGHRIAFATASQWVDHLAAATPPKSSHGVGIPLRAVLAVAIELA